MKTKIQETTNQNLREENPYEEFIERNVEFDESGCAKLKSSHGLARLLQRFHKEVLTQNTKEVVEKAIKQIEKRIVGRGLVKPYDSYADYCSGLSRAIIILKSLIKEK